MLSKSLSVGMISKAAMLITMLKTIAMLAGSVILNNGNSMMICYVLIIDHNCYSDAEIQSYHMKLPEIANFVDDSTDSAACANYSSTLPS